MNIEEIKAKYGPIVAKATRAQLEELALHLLRARWHDGLGRYVFDAQEYAPASIAADAVLGAIQAAPDAPTFRARVAVACNENGEWFAVGWDIASDSGAAAHAREGLAEKAVVHFIEADIPLPKAQPIEARVVEGGTK